MKLILYSEIDNRMTRVSSNSGKNNDIVGGLYASRSSLFSGHAYLNTHIFSCSHALLISLRSFSGFSLAHFCPVIFYLFLYIFSTSSSSSSLHHSLWARCFYFTSYQITWHNHGGPSMHSNDSTIHCASWSKLNQNTCYVHTNMTRKHIDHHPRILCLGYTSNVFWISWKVTVKKCIRLRVIICCWIK